MVSTAQLKRPRHINVRERVEIVARAIEPEGDNKNSLTPLGTVAYIDGDREIRCEIRA